MTIFEREFLKNDWPDLIELIQKNHVIEPNIQKELFEANVPVKGLTHTRGYFVIMGDIFIQYEMAHIVVNPELSLIGRTLDKVIVYDNFQEYESARVRAMSSVKDQTGMNFN